MGSGKLLKDSMALLGCNIVPLQGLRASVGKITKRGKPSTGLGNRGGYGLGLEQDRFGAAGTQEGYWKLPRMRPPPGFNHATAPCYQTNASGHITIGVGGGGVQGARAPYIFQCIASDKISGNFDFFFGQFLAVSAATHVNQYVLHGELMHDACIQELVSALG